MMPLRWKSWPTKCDENGGKNRRSTCNSQPHYYFLQTGVFLKIIQGKTIHWSDWCLHGFWKWGTQHLGHPSEVCPLSQSHEGLEPHDTPHWGVFPCGALRSRDGTTALPTLLPFLQLMQHFLFHTLPSSEVAVYHCQICITSWFDIYQATTFSTPAICSTVGKWY